jgi:hypothetical protein
MQEHGSSSFSPAARPPTLFDRIHFGPLAVDGSPGVGVLVELE